MTDFIGLAIIDEIEFSADPHEYDVTAVWRNESGRLFYADEQGCCQEPFAYLTSDELIEVTDDGLRAHLERRLDGASLSAELRAGTAAEISDLLTKARS